jgi:murein DD-endopeptidase MepM/ murein hydrolase activator NlpD
MKIECRLGQPFGGNAVATYVKGGLKGHTGVDNQCGYGTPIHAYWGNEYVYKVLTVQNPANDGSGFTGIFTIVDDERGCFEFLYGHCNPSVVVGQTLKQGEVIGTEGNNGEVYDGANGNTRVTLEMQKAGDHRGAHRHDQARELKKETVWDKNHKYLTDIHGTFFKDGFYYSIPNYENGYNGCYNWLEKKIDNTKFLNYQKALLDFQISENILDFQNEKDLSKIKLGAKTQAALKKYQK